MRVVMSRNPETTKSRKSSTRLRARLCARLFARLRARLGARQRARLRARLLACFSACQCASLSARVRVRARLSAPCLGARQRARLSTRLCAPCLRARRQHARLSVRARLRLRASPRNCLWASLSGRLRINCCGRFCGRFCCLFCWFFHMHRVCTLLRCRPAIFFFYLFTGLLVEELWIRSEQLTVGNDDIIAIGEHKSEKQEGELWRDVVRRGIDIRGT